MVAGTEQSLRPHALQARALARLGEELAGGGRGVVVMPCGSGKTLLGRWFAEQLAARLVVVCVPTLALVAQTVMAYRSQPSWRHAAMIACSDPTSGRAVALADLELPAWAREAVTASTSTRAIGEFLTGPTPGARLIVSTYHSAPRVAAALRTARRAAEVLVCDEAHRLTGQPRGEFRAVLDDGVLPAARRVFLTATPVEAAAWDADAHDDEATAPLSLDDEATFGPSVYRAAFADAVNEGLLVDYDVEVLATRRADEPGQRAGGAEAVLAAARDGSARILTFHSRVRHARDLARAVDGTVLPDGRVVRAEHLESGDCAGHRAAALERLAATAPGVVSVLASARVLTEGVDVPAVDTVVFADPKRSAVDIVQAVGRAMRRAPGKTRGRIVLSVTLDRADTGLDEDTELAGTAWRHVWVVLRALVAMDPRFARTLRTCARRPGPGGSRPHAGPGLTVDLPAGLDIDRWWLRALDRTGASWWHHLDVLRSWAGEHGHARPHAAARHCDVAIGSWVGRQRTMYRTGLLGDDRVAALEALPGWAWTDLDTAWWQAATRWRGYHATARGWVDEAQRWQALATQLGHDAHHPPRRAYASLAEFAADSCARARRGLLGAHLVRAAERLPAWEWDLIPAADAAMVDALGEYAAWRGDFNAPHDYHHDDDLPLGSWLTAVRRRRFTGRLHPALAQELALLARRHPTAVALRWETADTAWRLGLLALRQYAAREGRCRIPYGHTEALADHELNLSRWCVVQRQEHRYGRLPAQRVAALEQVGGWQWEVELREGYRPALDDTQHATRAGYAKGCRCDPCTTANRTYQPQHDRANHAGTDLVDATTARGHLRILLGRGATQKGLARASRLNVKTITEVSDGTLARVRPETHTALLALTLQAAADAALPGRWAAVPGGPTWELLDDMIARGWPKAWIAREIGHDGAALQLHRDRVSTANAAAVAELDRRLGRRRPPPRRWQTPLPTLAQLLAAEATADRGEAS